MDNSKKQPKTKNQHYVPQMYMKRFGYMIDGINNKTEEVLRKMCNNIGLSEDETEREIQSNCISGERQQTEYIVSLSFVLETMQRLLSGLRFCLEIQTQTFNVCILKLRTYM